ncbi:TolB family protein [Spongiimicrobium salis]|uniref:TolB family protein n=1 Tax=Spongiimicrobium salis TaxID=1667022 RepID=UPI00374D5B22
MYTKLFSFLSLLLGVFIAQGQQSKPKVMPALELLSSYPKARDFTISSSENEAYFTLQSPLEEVSVIAFTQKVDKKWSKPQIAAFSGKYNDLEPFLSPSGLQLYFASNRPMNEEHLSPKDYDLWYVERESLTATWSKPKCLPAPVNTSHNEFYPSVSNNGNLYFTSDSPKAKGKDDIFFSKRDGVAYNAPVSLPSAINTEGFEFNAFIAPDESYLIFSGYNRKDGLGSGDLYISYKNKEGNWELAKNMTTVNSKYMDYCPFVHVASKTLYFTSRRSSITPNKKRSIEVFSKDVLSYENGYSRIYKVNLKSVFAKE